MDNIYKIIKTTALLLISIIIFLSIALYLFVWITYNIKGDAIFEEDNSIYLSISDSVFQNNYLHTSYIMSSTSELELYLRYRAYSNQLPFIGELVPDSLDFANYDYIFSEGHSIKRMKILLYDDCSCYHTETFNREPLYFEFSKQVTNKVYVYKIKPKGKYRVKCE